MSAQQLVKQLSYPCPGEGPRSTEPLHKARARALLLQPAQAAVAQLAESLPRATAAIKLSHNVAPDRGSASAPNLCSAATSDPSQLAGSFPRPAAADSNCHNAAPDRGSASAPSLCPAAEWDPTQVAQSFPRAAVAVNLSQNGAPDRWSASAPSLCPAAEPDPTQVAESLPKPAVAVCRSQNVVLDGGSASAPSLYPAAESDPHVDANMREDVSPEPLDCGTPRTGTCVPAPLPRTLVLPGHTLQDDLCRSSCEGAATCLEDLPAHFDPSKSKQHYVKHKWYWAPALLWHTHRYLHGLQWYPVEGGTSWLELAVDLEAFVPEEDRADLPNRLDSKARRVQFMLEKVALMCGATLVPGHVLPGQPRHLLSRGMRLLPGILGWRPAFRNPTVVHACIDHVVNTGDFTIQGTWPATPAHHAPVPELAAEDPLQVGARLAAARALAGDNQTLYRQEPRRLEYNEDTGAGRHELSSWEPLLADQLAAHRALVCLRCQRRMSAHQLVKQLSYPCPGDGPRSTVPLHKARARTSLIQPPPPPDNLQA